MKKHIFSAILVLTLIIVACSNPFGGDNSEDADALEFAETTFNGNKGSTTYTLIVSHPVARAAVGDSFSLKVARNGSEKISSGKIVSVDGTNLVYQPKYKDAKAFTVGFSGSKLTHITGTITFDDGTSELGPGGFTNGSSGGGGSSAKGINVTITQPAPVTRGTKQLFTAIVNGTNDPDQKTVTWKVDGAISKNTSISPDGLLTVDASEPAKTLTVTAFSTFDGTKSGSAAVTLSGLLNVITPALELPMISSFSVIQNSNLTLSVSVANSEDISQQREILGGGITYKWFYNSTDSPHGLTAINDATKTSFKVPTVALGKLYYWVEVTNTIDIDDAEVVDTNEVSCRAGPIEVEVTKIPTGTSASILILQVGAAKDGHISHSFVELYNPGNTAVDLNGYSLQYAAGYSDNAGDKDGDWTMIELSGTIQPLHSFLILGAEGTSNSPALSIKDYGDEYGDINEAFVISNRCFKVALMSNTTLLELANPFDTDGEGTKADGYVDMVGALNSSKDHIQGFETEAITNLDKNTGQRRTTLKDTDNNKEDFSQAVYVNATADQKELRRPKNHSYGAWNPIQTTIEPSDPPVISGFGRDIPSVIHTDTVTVSATVTTTSSTDPTVVLQWKVNGTAQSDLDMTANGKVYFAVIPAHDAGSVVTYSVLATNSRGKNAVTAEQNYIVYTVRTDYTKLKLNEVSGVGNDPDKFYELINTGTEDIPLYDCKIYYNANGSTGGTLPAGKGSLTWTGLSTQTAQAGQLFSLIGRNTAGSFTTGLTAGRILIITLEDPVGNVIDKCVRAADTGEYAITDKSFSRISDGTGDFYFTTPTPNATNDTSTDWLTKVPAVPLVDPPVISNLGRYPTIVTSTDKATVSATVTTTSLISPVVLQWKLNGVTQDSINMIPIPAGNSYHADIDPQAVGAVVTYKVTATNNLGETSSTAVQSYTVAIGAIEPPPPPILILQAGASTNGAVSHNFVELYNAGNDTVDLSAYSLQYANGGNPTDSAWTVINLSGTLPKNHSYLILGNKWSGTRSDTAKFDDITDNSGDVNASFALSNDGFKVVLMSNQTQLTDENPFNINGSGIKAPGYVDMLGAVNGTSKPLHGFETAVMTKISKQQTARRTSLVDTDNNNDDFTNIDYRTTGNVKEYQYPKNKAYGAWDPFEEPTAPPPPPPLPTGLMILQVFGMHSNNDSAPTHSFIELYNNSDAAIPLNTFSVHWANGLSTNNNAPAEKDVWHKINLTGSIPARSSYLILGAQVVTIFSGTNGRLDLTTVTADLNEPTFLMSNRSYKVALMSNQLDLTESNPWGDAACIDLVSAINTAGTDSVTAAKGAVDLTAVNAASGDPSTISKQKSYRRTGLTVSGVTLNDFTSKLYNKIDLDDIAKFRPRTTADGIYTPQF